MARLLALVAFLAAFACAQALAPSCRDIARMITPCMAYLADRAWAPYGPCCSGVMALNQTAPTQENRVAICDCLKSIAHRLPMVDLTRAAVLPRTCGVNLNVTISPTIDCTSLTPP